MLRVLFSIVILTCCTGLAQAQLAQAPPVASREKCNCTGPQSCTCDSGKCECSKCIVLAASKEFREEQAVKTPQAPAPHRCTCGCEVTGQCVCPNCSTGCGFLKPPVGKPPWTPVPVESVVKVGKVEPMQTNTNGWDWSEKDQLWQSQSNPSHYYNSPRHIPPQFTPAQCSPTNQTVGGYPQTLPISYNAGGLLPMQPPMMGSFGGGGFGGGCSRGG